MLEATLPAKTLRAFLAMAEALVDEARIQATEAGIRLLAVDVHHVAMVDVSLPRAAFAKYRCDGSDFGLDLEKARNVLDLAKGDVEVELKHKDGPTLSFKIASVTRRLKTTDATRTQPPKIPELQLPASAAVPAALLAKGIKACASVADHAFLTVDDDGFQVHADGNTDTVEMRLSRPDLPFHGPETGRTRTRSMFSLDYLEGISKAVSEATDVTVQLGTDYPVRLSGELLGGRFAYLVAPRIGEA
jgi:proliferating cell nuclear antigen